MLVALAVALACTGSDLPPSSPPDQLRPAARCLINQARATEGLRRLRGYRRLRVAADLHAQDMVAHDYFAHERPGWTLSDRLALAGLAPVRAAETLLAGCGGLATPAETVRGLLDSPPHREILLDPHLRRMAIAVVPWMHGQGTCPDPGTWVLDYTGPT